MATTKFVNRKLYIDGNVKFPYIANNMIDARVNRTEPDPAFLADIRIGGSAWPDTDHLGEIWRYEKAGVYWNALTGSEQHSAYKMTDAQRKSKWFWCYAMFDEPDLHSVSAGSLVTVKNHFRSIDPDHISYLNVYANLDAYIECADVLSYDFYPLRDGHDRASFLLRWEKSTIDHALRGKRVSQFPKPIWTVIQAYGKHSAAGSGDATLQDSEPFEYRGQFYTALTMGFDGVIAWVYDAWGADGQNCGLVIKPSLLAEARRIGAEVKEMNAALCEDTIALGYRGNRDSAVQFSNNPMVTSPEASDLALNYILKPHLLIVVNKYNTNISTNITVQGKSYGSHTFKPYEVKIWKEAVPVDDGDGDVDGNDDGGNNNMIVKEYKNVNGRIQTRDAAIPLAPGFSVCIRTKVNSIAPSTWAQIISRDACWDIGIVPASYKDGEAKSGKLFFSYEDVSDLICQAIDMRQLIGRELHIAVVVDTREVRFYLDGVQKCAIPHSGQYSTNATLYPGETYNGYTTRCSIYNTVLTTAQVQADMAGTDDGGTDGDGGDDGSGGEDASKDIALAIGVAVAAVIAGYIITKRK